MMDFGARVVISSDSIEILEPGDLTMRALRTHRRAAEVLRGRPFWAASWSRAWFRFYVARLRLGREIEREFRSLTWRLRHPFRR